jgi:hypothetical protein
VGLPEGRAACPLHAAVLEQRQAEAFGRQAAELRARLEATEQQADQAGEQLAAERAQAAALRDAELRCTTIHEGRLEGWRVYVEELTEQLQVSERAALAAAGNCLL